MLQMKNELSGMKRFFVKMLVSIGTEPVYFFFFLKKKNLLSLGEKKLLLKIGYFVVFHNFMSN